MAIFLFPKWRPVAILDFVTGQKWVTAGCGLSMDSDRHACLSLCQIWWQYLNGGRGIAIFRFSKWRPAAILDLVQLTYYTTHDSALAVLSVLSNFVLIWLAVLFRRYWQFNFLTFGLKLPNHAHFLEVLWGFDTLDIFSHRNPQKAHPWVKPRRLRYTLSQKTGPLLHFQITPTVLAQHQQISVQRIVN